MTPGQIYKKYHIDNSQGVDMRIYYGIIKNHGPYFHEEV